MTCFPENSSLACTLFSRGLRDAGRGGGVLTRVFQTLPWGQASRQNHGVGLSEKAFGGFGDKEGGEHENLSDGPYYHMTDESRLTGCYVTGKAKVPRLFGSSSLDEREPRPQPRPPPDLSAACGVHGPASRGHLSAATQEAGVLRGGVADAGTLTLHSPALNRNSPSEEGEALQAEKPSIP